MSKLYVLGGVLVLVATVMCVVWGQSQFQPAQPEATDEVTIVIAKGQPASSTLDDLQSKGLIRSALVAKIYLKLSGLEQLIQNGTFVVSAGQDLPTLLTTLTKPPQDIWITIPEGWRREQIAERFSAQLQGVEKTFDPQVFMTLTRELEGQLFPDTYLVPRYATAEDVVAMMTRNFVVKTGIDPVSQRDELIIASLVEREGKTDSDRPLIAGILQNRLQAGWPLQIDASVQYGRDSDICSFGKECNWWAPLVNTQYPSPHNTYLRSGLPPTPISNPGLSAIQAVLNAPETSFWYYIHSPDGQAHFAVTLEEHNANVDKYLRD